MSSGGITGFPIGGIVSVVPGAGMTRTPSMTGFQHGSGAIRSGGGSQPPAASDSAHLRSSSAVAIPRRPRSRDRGRNPRAPSQLQAEERYRSQPVGPQEAEDWTVALEAVNDRLDTLERYSRLHGQSIAHIEEDRTMLLGKITSVIETLEKTTSDRADGIHARINEGGVNIGSQLLAMREANASKFLELESELALRDARIASMGEQMQSLQDAFTLAQTIRESAQGGERGRPQTFEVHTPPTHAAETAPPPPHQGIYAACGVPHPPYAARPNVKETEQPSMAVGQACIDVLGNALGRHPLAPPQSFSEPPNAGAPLHLRSQFEMGGQPQMYGANGQARMEQQGTGHFGQLPPQQHGVGHFGQSLPHQAYAPVARGTVPMPFGQMAREYQTPERPTGMGLGSPLSPVGLGHLNPAQQTFMRMQAAQGDTKPANFEISRKKNETLKVWTVTAGSEDFELWHDRMIDHISQANWMWRCLLEYVETATRNITKAETMTFECLGHNAWDLSVALENFLLLWLGTSLYKQRLRLCNREPSNGFELWRRLVSDNKGSGVVVRMAGSQALETFPQCQSVPQMGAHLDAWDDLFAEFGQELEQAPIKLFTMFKSKLPTSIINELLDHPEITDYDSLKAFCRRRTEFRKEQELCESTKKRILAKTRLGAMPMVHEPASETEGAPKGRAEERTTRRQADWRNEQVCAGDVDAMIVAAMTRNGNRGNDRPGGRSKTPPRGRSPGNRSERVRFMWDGSCWHCKSKDHKRDTCEAYKKICGSDGKAPDGYVSAYHKAKKAWQASRKPSGSKGTHVKAALLDDTASEDESDTDAEGDPYAFAMKVVTAHPRFSQPTTVKNQFQTLESSTNHCQVTADHCQVNGQVTADGSDGTDGSLSDGAIAELTSWCGRVNKSKRKVNVNNGVHVGRDSAAPPVAAPRRPVHRGIISSEKDLDAALSSNPKLMAAMPCQLKAIKKAAKKCPGSEELGPNEQWVMVDSGAGVNGIDASKHCPALLHKLRDATKRRKCITANGGEMVIDKEIDLDCEFGDHKMSIVFADLPVQCPILSVRRIIKKGNRVIFNDGGGFIEHTVTRRRINFIEREGVYFIKMNINSSPSPFVRQ